MEATILQKIIIYLLQRPYYEAHITDIATYLHQESGYTIKRLKNTVSSTISKYTKEKEYFIPHTEQMFLFKIDIKPGTGFWKLNLNSDFLLEITKLKEIPEELKIRKNLIDIAVLNLEEKHRDSDIERVRNFFNLHQSLVIH